MPYLLDGNNLIGLARRTGRPSEEEGTALIAELSGRLRRTRAKAVLFFDGPGAGRPLSLGNLSVRPSVMESADEQILREIERSANPGEMIVVTADRELGRRAKEAGGRHVLPEEFWGRFGRRDPGGGAVKEPQKIDVEDWLRYFEDERNRGK
jgi:hypothetical protein